MCSLLTALNQSLAEVKLVVKLKICKDFNKHRKAIQPAATTNKFYVSKA